MTYTIRANAPATIVLNYWTDDTKTVGKSWTAIGTSWLAELRPNGGPAVTNASATFSIDTSGAVASGATPGKLVLSLTSAQVNALLGGSVSATFGWDLYETTGDTPVVSGMSLNIQASYTHPAGSASPSATTPVGVYDVVTLGTVYGNVQSVDVLTGAAGPTGPAGAPGAALGINDVTASPTTTYSSTHTDARYAQQQAALAAAILRQIPSEQDVDTLYTGTAPVLRLIGSTINPAPVSTISGGVRIAPARTTRGGTTVDVDNDPHFNYLGGAAGKLAYGAAFPANAFVTPSWLTGGGTGVTGFASWTPRVRFFYTGRIFEAYFLGVGTAQAYRLTINGKRCTKKMQLIGAGRTVTDGVLTSGSKLFTSATAAFTSADIGLGIKSSGNVGITAGTAIQAAWEIAAGGADHITVTVTTPDNGALSTASIATAGLTGASLQTSIAALSNVGTGNITGTGGGPWDLYFASTLGNVTVTVTGTGGSPTITSLNTATVAVMSAAATATTSGLTTSFGVISGNGYLLRVDLGTAAARTIQIDLSGSQITQSAGMTFGGLFVEPTAAISRGPKSKWKMLTFANSIGAGDTNNNCRHDNWPVFLADYLGSDEWVNQSIGGTDYSNPGGFVGSYGSAKFSDRVVPDVNPVAAQLILISPGVYNDTTYTQTQITTDATAALTALTAGNPNAIIIVGGSWTATGLVTAIEATMEAGAKAAAAALGLPFVSMLDYLAQLATAPAWVTATAYVVGDVVQDPTSGGATVYLCTVGHTSSGSTGPDLTKFTSLCFINNNNATTMITGTTHPSAAGLDYLSRWWKRAIVKILRQIAVGG